MPDPRGSFLEEVVCKVFRDHRIRTSEGERMEVLTAHDKEPLSAWDSGLGFGGVCGLRPGGLKSQRMVLSRAMTQMEEV